MKMILSLLAILCMLISCSVRHDCMVKSQQTGLLKTNCYLVYDQITKEAALIDPGDTIPALLRIIDTEQLSVKYVIITHCHPDHIKGVNYIKEKFPDARICVSPVEYKDMQEYARWRNIFDTSLVKAWSKDTAMQQLMDLDYRKILPPEIALSENKSLRLGSLKLKVLETPGHSRGSITIAVEHNLFTGDLILFGETGDIRYKFNSREDLVKSIHRIYDVFPDSTMIYPGHGNRTTVGVEKKTNKRVPDEKERAHIAYRIPENDLIPEGIAYSSSTNSFYIGSIFKTKIIRVNAETGVYMDFIPSDNPGLQVLGMTVDERTGSLWACANGIKNGHEIAAVIRFDLHDGKQLTYVEFADTVPVLFNDLALDNDGNVYFTNSSGETIYRIDHRTGAMTPFIEGKNIACPNGITISPDNKFLYVASETNGIRIIDIEKKIIVGEKDTTFISTGIDGLKYYQNSLIGIQNGVWSESEIKICRYFLNEAGNGIVAMEIIDQDNFYFNIPTTFVIVKDHLFCLATSQLRNLSKSGYELISRESLTDILVLKYDIDQ
ncbi:MAG: MBL fold metallo-hydrolase [Bacteroidales bacterium]|nr:MBL fold metallo-hydrolase [Bacteroidales bacterium]